VDWLWVEVKASTLRQRNNDTEVSTQGHTVDALPQSGYEGREYLRKATGSGKYALIRGCPNGATQLESCPVTRKRANPEN
jgi:hypothetical protein